MSEARPRVLVVDDSETQALRLCLLLESEGWETAAAVSAEDALAALDGAVPDLLVVDFFLPGMNGDELCRRLRGRESTATTPILMLTAETGEDAEVRGLECGADDYVAKTASDEILLLRIRALQRKAEATRLASELRRANAELEEANRRLKETQVQLVHSEKMASLGQLVAGVAHEINNPLAFVLTSFFIAAEDLDKVLAASADLPPAVATRLAGTRERMADAQEGLERVRDLVLGLRTFSRLDEGEFKVVDVDESIDSVLMFLRHKMDGRIEVRRRSTGRRELGCYGGQLNQVLMNIVANAVDAMPDGGVLTIETGEEGDMFTITVADTGHGMPESVRRRIFEPFFTTKPVGSGTGLGLAISYGIVEKHQGSITVESREGEGSTFRIRIPLDLETRLKES